MLRHTRGVAVAALTGVCFAGCGTGGLSPKAYDSKVLGQPASERAVWAEGNAAAVVVAPEVLDGWDFLYRFITEVEFVLCLEGTKKDGRVYVESFRLARMEASSVNSVRYQPCTSDKYVGTAHNHPPVGDSDRSLCYQSEPDRRSFGLDPKAVVDIVLCGDQKFLWVLKDGRTGSMPEEIAARN